MLEARLRGLTSYNQLRVFYISKPADDHALNPNP
jgi:hypothetical protein